MRSVRDPRDAVISMAQRFKAPVATTVRWIARDCDRVMRLAPRARILLPRAHQPPIPSL
jgi:hypothetical protein